MAETNCLGHFLAQAAGNLALTGFQSVIMKPSG